MISARRAALLGLTVPLTPIMIAVLGLWPEQEDDAPVSQQTYGGGGSRRWRSQPPKWLVPKPVAVRATSQKSARQPDPDHEAQVRAYWDAIDEIRARDKEAPPAGAARAPEPPPAVTAAVAAPEPAPAVPAAPIAPAAATRSVPHPDNAALEAILLAELA